MEHIDRIYARSISLLWLPRRTYLPVLPRRTNLPVLLALLAHTTLGWFGDAKGTHEGDPDDLVGNSTKVALCFFNPGTNHVCVGSS